MGIEQFLSNLTTHEKLAALDFLWRDLTKEPAGFPSPAWHEHVLRERLANPSTEPSMELSEAIDDIRSRLNARRTTS